MAKDFESLKQQALVIKNEVEDGANSSERIGGMFSDMLDYNEEERKEISNKTAGVNYLTCDTAASTAAKTVSITGLTSLTTGIRLLVKMTNNNTASNATLNINSLGAKPLYYDNERASSDNSWEAGEVIDIYYDGANFYSSNVQGGSSDGGNKTLTWNTDAATTRKQVQLKDRKELLIVSYKDGEGNAVNEQYIGTAFDDTNWANETNWVRVYDSDFNDSVKDFFSVWGEENTATFVSDKYVKADTGDIVENIQWKYYEASVKGYKKISCKVGFANSSSNVGLSFYDENDTYISGYYKLINEGSEDVELEIPDGAVTARWSWLHKHTEYNGEYKLQLTTTTSVDSSKIKYGSMTQGEFNDSVLDKIESVDLTEKTYVADSTAGYYVKADTGDIVGSSAWKYYEASVKGYKKILCRVGFAETAANVGIAFYDESDTFISGYYQLIFEGYEDVELEIPDGAVTARWSWLNSKESENDGTYSIICEKSLSDDSDVIDHNTANLLIPGKIEKTFNDGVNSFTPPNDGYSMSNPITARAGDWITRTGTETGMIVVTDENDTNGQRLYKSDGSTLGASFQIPKDLEWVRYIRLAVEEEGANDGSVVICKGKYAFTGSEKGDFLTIPKLRVEKRNLTNDLLYIQNEDGSKYFKVYVDADGNIKAKEVDLVISESELPTNWKTLTLQGSFNGYFDRFVIMNTDFLIDLSEDGPMKIKAISPALTSTYSNFEHFYTSDGKGRYVVDTLQNVVDSGKGITIFDNDFNVVETNITGGDIHDFEYISDDHLIILTSEVANVEVPGGSTKSIRGIAASEIKKIDGVWRKIGYFAAIKYPQLCTDAFGDMSTDAIDNHHNTVGLDYDGNLILNMRNWDSFIKVKRTENHDGTVTLGSDTYDYDEAIIGRVGGRRNSGYIDSKRVLPEGFSFTDVPQSLTEVSDDDWEDWQWFHCHDVKYWGMKNIDGKDYPTYTLFDNNMFTGTSEAPNSYNATNKHNNSSTNPNGANNVSRVVQISVDWDNHLIKDYRVYVIPKMYSSEQGGATMYEEGVISISYSYQGTFGLWDFRTASTQVSGNVYTGAKQLFLGKYTSYGYCYRANTYKIE